MTEQEDSPSPLSFAQQRLWFLAQLEPGSAEYNLPLAFRLRGHLDRPALERAIGEIVRRHEILRTRFESRDGIPVQVVEPPVPLLLSLVDLTLQEPDRSDLRVLALLRDEAERPFDLERGPLFRVRLLAVRPEEHVLLLCMHHIVSDGWSLGVLVRELSVLYDAFSVGDPSPLEELPLQYREFARRQRSSLEGPALAPGENRMGLVTPMRVSSRSSPSASSW